jgi:hypothetical protein
MSKEEIPVSALVTPAVTIYMDVLEANIAVMNISQDSTDTGDLTSSR